MHGELRNSDDLFSSMNFILDRALTIVLFINAPLNKWTASRALPFTAWKREKTSWPTRFAVSDIMRSVETQRHDGEDIIDPIHWNSRFCPALLAFAETEKEIIVARTSTLSPINFTTDTTQSGAVAPWYTGRWHGPLPVPLLCDNVRGERIFRVRNSDSR